MRGVSFRSYPQGCDSVSTFVHLFYIKSTGYSRNATIHPILHNNPKRPLPSNLRPLRPSPRLSLPLLRPRHAFDLITVNGLVRPLALDLSTYEFPNGASIRPNTSVMQKLARTAKNPHVCIYCVAKGTELPEDLILVHEFRDHYSLQAGRGMGVDDLNEKITDFLSEKGERLSREGWLWRFPRAAEEIS
ncbi:uncharacterized protein ASPGLDRAFT_1360456 [Aspergillus glaucus CBS 516.65]|uniref:Tse2 ADP-ribosyltransferase toxin domain-containing protein n=1 Tax=Aspergillus glaucus CBS 516.65 TaxID=1160497 RepID=A0A1L9VNP2_ASPGL|nr:hypothetical protein ASPGLDRAFT_1360456 [Aspergillus glaucus CBS 516.65]OJJ85526.1 hypothetical protein ASPGLDRAFT_1360456 [Aspergillus glaucus CBS 516.65]